MMKSLSRLNIKIKEREKERMSTQRISYPTHKWLHLSQAAPPLGSHFHKCRKPIRTLNIACRNSSTTRPFSVLWMRSLPADWIWLFEALRSNWPRALERSWMKNGAAFARRQGEWTQRSGLAICSSSAAILLFLGVVVVKPFSQERKKGLDPLNTPLVVFFLLF